MSTAKEHPEFARLEQVYGSLSHVEIRDRLGRMEGEIFAHQKAGRREFNGNGGRRTSAAVSSASARDVAQEKQLLTMYANDKFGERGLAARDLLSDVGTQIRKLAKGLDREGAKMQDQSVVGFDSGVTVALGVGYVILGTLEDLVRSLEWTGKSIGQQHVYEKLKRHVDDVIGQHSNSIPVA